MAIIDPEIYLFMKLKYFWLRFLLAKKKQEGIQPGNALRPNLFTVHKLYKNVNKKRFYLIFEGMLMKENRYEDVIKQ